MRVYSISTSRYTSHDVTVLIFLLAQEPSKKQRINVDDPSDKRWSAVVPVVRKHVDLHVRTCALQPQPNRNCLSVSPLT